MKFIANFVDTFQHVSILLNSCPGKLSTRIQSFFFFSEVVGKVAICRGGIFLVFAHPYALRIFTKFSTEKTGRWLFF